MRILDIQTRFPLEAMIKRLVEYIQSPSIQRTLNFNRQIIGIFEGELETYVDAALQRIYGSKFEKVNRTKVLINVHRQLIKKQSKVYTEDIVRTVITPNDVDTELLEWYEKILNFNVVCQDFTEFYNQSKYGANYLWLNDGVPVLKNGPADNTIPYSDYVQDYTIPTVMLTSLGKFGKYNSDQSSGYGADVDVWLAISANEIVIFDMDEKRRVDLELEFGYLQRAVNEESGEVEIVQIGNPLGYIPAVYVNQDNRKLIPTPDTDLRGIALDPSIQLTDLRFGQMYANTGVIAVIDADDDSLIGLQKSGDTIWNIKSDNERDGTTASIQPINPDIRTESALMSIQATIQMFLTSRGFTIREGGNVGNNRPEAALTRLIEESDAVSSYREQIEVYRSMEAVLWELIARTHNYWVDNGMIEETRRFSDTFDVRVQYSVAQPTYGEEQLVDILTKEVSLGVESIEGSIRRLNPDITDEALLEKVQEIEAGQSRRGMIANMAGIDFNLEDDNGGAG